LGEASGDSREPKRSYSGRAMTPIRVTGRINIAFEKKDKKQGRQGESEKKREVRVKIARKKGPWGPEKAIAFSAST